MNRLQVVLIITLFLAIGLIRGGNADRVQLTTSAAVVSDNLGASVGISGDYAIIGVPKDDTDNGRNAGSIQVFFRSETGWVQHQKLHANDAAQGDEFGTTLAIDGDYVVVGAPRKTGAGRRSGAAYVFTRQGPEWVEQAKLVASDENRGDYFGISVAIDGNTVLVGAHRSNEPDADAGTVYVFERTGTNWSQTARLNAPDADKFAYFGFSVGIDADTAIIGATRDDGAGNDAGAAYIFIRNQFGWSFQAKLIGNNTKAEDNFGYAVDVDGDFAIASSPRNSGSGAVYIYKREGTEWKQKRNRIRQRMIPIDPEGATAFGVSVAIQGDIAVIGAAGGIIGDEPVGAVYIFAHTYPPFWNQDTKLAASERSAGDQLGFSVAIHGDEVIAGAPKHSAGGLASGAASIFEKREEGGWVETVQLSDGDTASEEQFGISVSISGNFAISGAQQDDSAAPNAGAVYVFERSGTLWLQRTKLVADDAKAGDLFGSTVALSGDTAVIGAVGVDDAGPEAGSVYVFLRVADEWFQQAKLIGADVGMFDRFGTTVAIHENTAVVGAAGKDEVGEDSGAAYIFIRNGTNWAQQAKLTHPDAVPGDLFGFSVAVNGDNVLVGTPLSNTTGPDSGAAYLFTRNGDSWNHFSLKLIPNDTGVGDAFGYAVALSEDAAIIGAPKEDRSGEDMGAAYIYVETKDTWVQQAKLIATDGEAGDEFGSDVAIHQNTALVGAWKDDHPLGAGVDLTLEIDKGSAYTFLREDLSWVQKRRIVAGQANRADLFGASVAIQGAFAIVGAAGNDTAGDNSGSAFIYNPIDLGFLSEDVPFSIDPASRTLTTLGHIKQTTVFQNYPNPFNPETWLPYNLAQKAAVTVDIYDVQGRLVRRLNIGIQDQGSYQSQEKAAYWNGRDEFGAYVASGIYFYTFTVQPVDASTGEFQTTRRMVIMK